RCCPYCNFCCNGLRTTTATGRKKREVTVVDAAAASPSVAVAPAAATTPRSTAVRKMLAMTQRSIVKREKRQNRNRESPQCPLCPCAWCSRSANRHPYASSSRDEPVREPADYAHSGAPSATYPRGGGAPPARDADYPYAPDFPPAPMARPRRFRSYGGGASSADDAYSAQRYSERGANPEGFNPRARMPQGGPVRGSGPFARALQMTSPFPWMRNWLSDQIRMRHRILGYE
ncbi:hypothetical protein PENTCL1PPCAC_25658, partial [Pristionchus entomophagus]